MYAVNALGVLRISPEHNIQGAFETDRDDVLAVADNIAVLYLGQMVAQVKATDVTHAQVVELITAGRSGELGLAPAEAAQSM